MNAWKVMYMVKDSSITIKKMTFRLMNQSLGHRLSSVGGSLPSNGEKLT
jgi:hypothetical protein